MAALVPVLFPTLVAGSTGAILAGVGLSVVGSLLLGAASRALSGPQTGSVSGPQTENNWAGTKVTVRAAVAPRVLVYGQRRVGGNIIYMTTTGSRNQYLHMIVALSSCKVKSIGAVYFGDQMAVNAAGFTQSPWHNLSHEADELPDDWFEIGEDRLVYIDKRLGDPGQTAFTGLPNEWTSQHTVSGVACVYLRLCYVPSKFPNGLPEVTFDVEGCAEVYDPRTDTVGYSNNAALCTAHYLCHQQFGFGMVYGAEDGLNTESVIEAANICDETVATTSGGSESRYTCNGIVSLGEEPMTNLRELLTCMAGGLAEVSGQHHLQAGAYRLPVMDLTLNDAVGSLEIQTRRSMAESFNGVRGVFISPENNWQPDDFPAYQSLSYINEDNGFRRWKDIKLPFTTSSSMAQRLARIELEKARRQISIRLPGKLETWRVPAGENITLTHPIRGWDRKPFTVTKTELSVTEENGSIKIETILALQETSPLVYSWTASEAAIYAAAPRTSLPTPFTISPPGILSADESLYVTKNGGGVKAKVTLTWTVNSIVAFHKVFGRINGGEMSLLGETSSQYFEVLDIAPGLWEFQIRAFNALGVSSMSETFSKEVRGLSAPPDALTNPSIQSAGGLVILNWDLPSDLDVRVGGQIVIRHSSSGTPLWENSVSVATIAGNQSQAQVPNMAGAYLVRPQDTSGILGPVTTLLSSGAEAVNFVSAGVLQEDNDFLGPHTNTSVSAGSLRIAGDGFLDDVASIDAVTSIDYIAGRVIPQGVYEFATAFDFGSIKSVRLRREIEMVVENINDFIDSRSGSVDDWLDVDGAVTGAEVDVQVEIATSNDTAPVWSAWVRLDRQEVRARHVKARAVLTSNDLSFTPVVSKLRVYADEVL